MEASLTLLLSLVVLLGVARAGEPVWPGGYGGAAVVERIVVPEGAVPPGPATAAVASAPAGGSASAGSSAPAGSIVHSVRFEMPARGSATVRLWFSMQGYRGTETHALAQWLGHYAATVGVGVLAAGFAVTRIARLRD